MRRILIASLLSFFYISLQAQIITFNALKNGVIDTTEIKKELILNGFTKVTASPNSSTDTYVYNYDETKETASIWVSITAVIELENSGLYEISVRTSGDYIHDELVKEITEKCTFEGLRNDALMYSCEYTLYNIYSVGGNRNIIANPNYEQMDMESPEIKELLKVGEVQEK